MAVESCRTSERDDTERDWALGEEESIEQTHDREVTHPPGKYVGPGEDGNEEPGEDESRRELHAATLSGRPECAADAEEREYGVKGDFAHDSRESTGSTEAVG